MTVLGWIFAAVVLAFVLAVLAVALRVRRMGGVKLAYYGDAILYKRNCMKCSGGAQRLNDDGRWGPVPASVRMDLQRDDRGRYFGPPSALIRTCPHCTGMGFHLDAAEHATLPRPL